MTWGEPVNPEHYRPLPQPLTGQTTAADIQRMLRTGRTHGIGRPFRPRYPGDGLSPTIATHKPGAFTTDSERRNL